MRVRAIVTGFAVALMLTVGRGEAETGAVVLPAPALDDALASGADATAVLAGGCYWGMQGLFEHVKGVRRVVAGYTGGRRDAAESVEITYDPAAISYGRLLQIFFSVAHDPTELDRQGPDTGAEYRSDIFYWNDRQRVLAAAYIAQLGKAHLFPAKIVTRLDAFAVFHPVGRDQQDYLLKNPDSPYIVDNDLPKIAALKRLFPALYRPDPVRYGD